jgi:glutathione S-transferase
MQLYYAPDSIALASHIALSESSLPYSLVKVDHHVHVNEDGSSYFEINPNGYVPSLRLDDGKILHESIAIMQLIADSAPESGLCPPVGTPERYRVLSWAGYVATEIHQKFMRFTQPDVTPAQSAAIVDLLKQRVAHAEEQLERSAFLEGDRPTIADFFLFVASGWLKYQNVSTEQWPHLHRYRAILGERPAVRKALKEEGLA